MLPLRNSIVLHRQQSAIWLWALLQSGLITARLPAVTWSRYAVAPGAGGHRVSGAPALRGQVRLSVERGLNLFARDLYLQLNVKRCGAARRPGMVLNGVRQFITTGRKADAIVIAVTDLSQGKKACPTSCYRLTPPASGLPASKKAWPECLGYGATLFENCRARINALIGEEGRATRLRCRFWKQSASALPRDQSAWPAQPMRPRWRTPMSAHPSA